MHLPTTRIPRRMRAPVMTAVAIALSGCGDDPIAPTPTGSVTVVTSTSGQSLDPDGYSVTVAGGAALSIDADGTETVTDVAVGAQTVELTGVAPNCTVDGENPRDVTVDDGGTAVVTFDVECLLVAFDRLSITSDRSGNSEVYLINPDGTNPTNITNNPALDAAGAISPNGTHFTFTSDRAGNLEVFIARVDGTGVMNLSNSPGADAFASWSPDGTRLSFTSERSGDLQIWTIGADGSNPVNLTQAPGTGNTLNEWSPDG
jgi:hypothetical protein